MSDALARYRMAERQDRDALKRYKDASTGDTLGALAKYLGLRGYWDRQGQIANESLQMADEGAQAVRGGNFSGLPGLALGPLRYIGSPVEALFPQRSEVEAATDVPEWSKPLIAGGLETMAIMAPGPKVKGLGRGMAQLTDAATDAERAALGSRLEAEAVQGQNAGMTNDILYHGGDPLDISKFERGGNVYWTTPSREYAENYGNIAGEHRLSPDARILDLSEVSPTTSLTADEFIELLSGRGVTVRPDGPKFLHDLMPEDVGPPELLQYLQRQDVIEDIAKNFDVIKQNEYIADRTNGASSAVSYGVLNPSALTNPVTRDQALRNLTEAPSWNPSALKDKYAAMSRDDLLTEAVKRGGVANPDKLSAPKLRQALFDMDVSDEQSRNMGKMVDRSLKNDPTSWQ